MRLAGLLMFGGRWTNYFMNPDQIAITGLILVMFALFAWNKWRYDIVAVIALVALVALDAILGGETSELVKDPKRVLEGFGHPAVVTVAAVLIISRALRNSGVVDQISRSVMPFTKNQIPHILSLSLVVMVLSAFMNNVGALALMLPVALKTAVDRQRSPTILLLPMAFASILGGMMTMIGTPPNIIIANLRVELTRKLPEDFIQESAFGLFDFFSVGGLVAVAGLLFIVLIGWRLIPGKSHKKPGMESLFQINDYITEISTPADCKWVGKTVTEVEELVGEKMAIFGFIRKDDKVLPPNPDGIIQEGCRYVVKADPVELQGLIEEHGLHLSKEMRHRIDSLKGENTGFTEAIVTAGSPLLGRTRTHLRRHSGNTMTLMAVARQNKPIRKQLKEVVFRVGDVLLLHGKTPEMDDTIADLNLLPLAERELNVGTFSRIGLSVAIFAGAIGLSMTGFPMTIAFLGAVLAYILCGILPLRDIYREVEWPIIVLLGAMIPVSQAFQSTDCTGLIAESIKGLTGALPSWSMPWSMVSLVMIVTMCLSDIINNAATAFIMAPIAVGISGTLGLQPDPFLMAVAVGASCAFLTPIGHQCNAMILGPGGYRFWDYWKVGLPLEIVIVLIGTPLILHFWPLS
ncbi:MAG: SLC13 family permease [Verrucomicrobia bacterium]|nr:MAG: SLC13 family permease [Verrucomicrobiota bacterium]